MIILASGSPRRRELLQMLDVEFKVDTSIDVDESYPATLAADEVPLFLSRLKAKAHLPYLKADDILITADTVVILDNEVIGKPRDEEDAKRMIGRLSGRVHHVVTGVTIVHKGEMKTLKAMSKVEFAPLNEDEIDFYVIHYHPIDKAGAYGIQEWIGAAAIRSIEGSFYNVMGLPIHLIYNELKRLGVTVK